MLFSEESYKINGALFKVHQKLGPGLLERVYQEALAIEFKLSSIPFEREKEFPIIYQGCKLQTTYKADFVCYGKIIVELKAVEKINDTHTAQVINYLNIANLQLGLLQNMNVKKMKPAIRLFGRTALDLT